MSKTEDILSQAREAMRDSEKYQKIIEEAEKYDCFKKLRDSIHTKYLNDSENNYGPSFYHGDNSEDAIIFIIRDWAKLKEKEEVSEITELIKRNEDLENRNIFLDRLIQNISNSFMQSIEFSINELYHQNPNYVNTLITRTEQMVTLIKQLNEENKESK